MTIPQRLQRMLDAGHLVGYQALLQMGTAILWCAGFRTRGSQGHHANTFYAAAALGIDGLEEIEITTERIRKMRKTSAYEPGSASPEQLAALKRLINDLMPPAQRWLAGQRPGVPFPAYESG